MLCYNLVKINNSEGSEYMKSIKKIIAVLLVLTTMTGCVKYNNTMTINNDKSMTFEGSYLMNDKIVELMKSMSDGTETTESTEEIDEEELKKRGITVTEKKENGYTGFTFSKKYNNIDDLSNETGKEVVISEYISKGFDETVLFKVEKGFLKNKYTAKFTFDTSTPDMDNGLTSYAPSNNKELAMGNISGSNTPNLTENNNTNNTTNNNTTNNTTGNNNTTIPENGTTTNDTENCILNEDGTTNCSSEDESYKELEKLTSEMEFSFVVNLPEKPLSNNAAKTENDGKKLVWNIESNKNVPIEFTFELKNMTNYYILYGGIAAGVIILIIIIIMIIKKGKKGKEVIPAQNEPIHADYDPSIAAAIPNPALVNGNVNNDVTTEVASTEPVSENTNVVDSTETMNQTEQEAVQNEIQSVSMEQAQTPQVEIPTVETANGPIGNSNTEPQAHIIPEVTVEPQVVEPITKPTFITPENTKEEPIVIEPQPQEIKIDAPQTIDMNQN